MNPTVRLGGVDNTVKVMKDIGNLSALQVYVGIPESAAARKSGAMNNAQLTFLLTHGVRSAQMRSDEAKIPGPYPLAHALYLHTHGSALWHTPPRPIVEPAIEAKGNKEAICAWLKKAAEAVLNGDKGNAMRWLNMAGMEATNRVRAWFVDPRNGWPSNAPSTIKAKGSSQPNIDQGELRKAITYVVAE